MKKGYVFLGALALACLVAAGCSKSVNGPSGQNVTPAQELSYNYMLLSYFYYHPEELKPSSEAYVGTGSETEEYGDVLAMYATLSDDYTHYFTPSRAAAIYSRIFTSGGGALVGIEMTVKADSVLVDGNYESKDTIVLQRVYTGSPAEAAGIRKGDKILFCNGVDVTGKDVLDRYQELAGGGVGTQVKLTLLRGDETLNFVVVKAEMNLPTVYLDSLQGIPVLQVTQFSESSLDSGGTLAEFRAVLGGLKGSPVAVLDLRGNPGGSVDHCVAMADELIADGVIIREVNHYYDEEKGIARVDTLSHMAKAGGLGEGTQWVFLADGNSASCSEILLSAARTRLKSAFVGDTTFGKGIGQYYMWTWAKGLAGITALQFFDQDWKSYHHVGLAPDTVIVDADSALAQALSIALGKMPAAGGALPRRVATLGYAQVRDLSARLAMRREESKTAEGGAWKMLDVILPLP